MADTEFLSYGFQRSDQWQAGVLVNLEATDDGLLVVPNLGFSPLPGTTASDATSALAVDPCGQLHWIRPADGRLVRFYDFGPQGVGTLAGAEGPIALMVGAKRIWLLTAGGLSRYAQRRLQLLGQTTSSRRILAIAGDHRDGVWWLEGGDDGEALLRHNDASGRKVQTPIGLATPLRRARLGVSSNGRNLVVLDPPSVSSDHDACGCESSLWSLISIDICTQDIRTYPDMGFSDRNFRPELMIVDRADHVHVLDPRTGRFWTLGFAGQMFAQRDPQFPPAWLPFQALSATKDALVLAGQQGMGTLRPAPPARAGRETTSMFISPTLVSPEGAERGWMRADIDAVLPEGTTLEVTPATTRDRGVARDVDAVLANEGCSPMAKEAAVSGRLSWQSERTVVFTGHGETSVTALLRYPLQEIEEAHLWLRLVLYTPPGRQPPMIKRLTVYYPNKGYLRYLPAVYQEKRESAVQLRRFLTLFESLFGDLDNLIAGLPENIDPRMAPTASLPLLLRWLGFPSGPNLTADAQRQLLLKAPDLLAKRGTREALQSVLEIVSGAQVSIEDLAAGPLPWVLPNQGAAARPARLGRDTLVLAQDPPPFRLGRSARLGEVPLGLGSAHPVRALVRRGSELRIRIAATGEARSRLQSVLAALLSDFVPAHCHYTIEFAQSRFPQGRRLGSDLRLAGGRSAELGSDFVLGRRALPATALYGAIIGRSTVLGRGLHLN